jgi:hypothetical protein
MSTHVAEYFRQRRRAQGVPERDPFSSPKFLYRATELLRLEQLPWPRNLFGELASIAELMAASAYDVENADGACSCGCRKEHKHNVADAAEPVRSRLRCYLLPLGSLQEQVEPGAAAERGTPSLSPAGPT